MLSARVRYGIGALSYLARRALEPRTTDQIAAVTGVPSPTLAKILQALSRAGIIRTQRGSRGGVCLARDPREVSVLDVVEAIDTAAYRRFLHPETTCPCLHRRLASVRRLVELVLSRTTIAELAGRDMPKEKSTRAPIDQTLDRVLKLTSHSPRSDRISDSRE